MRKARKKRGRPALPTDRKLAVKVQLAMTQAMWAELEATAAERGITPTDLIRERIAAGAKINFDALGTDDPLAVIRDPSK